MEMGRSVRWGSHRHRLGGGHSDAKRSLKKCPHKKQEVGKRAGKQNWGGETKQRCSLVVIQLKRLWGLEKVAGASLGRKRTVSGERHMTSKVDLGASG